MSESNDKTTLQQAYGILGLSQNATKAEINAAYRKLIAKYHPDANRNKPEEQRKDAEAKFKSITKAYRIVLNPKLAHNPPSSGEQHSRQWNNMGDDFLSENPHPHSPRRKQSFQSPSPPSPNSPHSSDFAFNDNGRNEIENHPDDAERIIHQVYAKETKSRYKASSDKWKLTPSLAVSIAYAAIITTCTWGLLMPNASHGEPSNLENTMPGLTTASMPIVLIGILVIIAVMSILYSLLISFYPMKHIMKKHPHGWITLCGAEAMALGLASLIAIRTIGMTASSSLILTLPFAILTIIGASMIPLGLVSKKNPIHKKHEKKRI